MSTKLAAALAKIHEVWDCPDEDAAPAEVPTTGPLCPERRAIAPVGVPLHGVTCPVCNCPPGQWCLSVADALALLDAATREIALVREGWRESLSIVEEARELRRAWRDVSGSSDDAYGAKSEAFWRRIEGLDVADPSAIDEPLRAEVAA